MRVQLFLVAALISAGCGKKDADPETVHILAAASTKEAVREAADLFEKAHDVRVVLMADASSTLATQVINDAPADLFLSANDKWADVVREKGHAEETKPLLSNMLVLIVPKGNPAHVKKPEDLAAADVKKIALAGPNVPAGIYGRQALTTHKVWDAVDGAKKVVSAKDVRAVLAYVEQGEVEAGIVYDTDARISDQVEIAYTFAPSAHEAIRYPLVLLKQGHEKAAGRKFYEFLLSDRAAEVFRKHGFTPLAGKGGP